MKWNFHVLSRNSAYLCIFQINLYTHKVNNSAQTATQFTRFHVIRIFLYEFSFSHWLEIIRLRYFPFDYLFKSDPIFTCIYGGKKFVAGPWFAVPLFYDMLALLKEMEMGRVYFSWRHIMVATLRVCKCNSCRSVLNFVSLGWHSSVVCYYLWN